MTANPKFVQGPPWCLSYLDAVERHAAEAEQLYVETLQLANEFGWSFRALGEHLDIPHTTIARWVKDGTRKR